VEGWFILHELEGWFFGIFWGFAPLIFGGYFYSVFGGFGRDFYNRD
jgi:hypothetical protein